MPQPTDQQQMNRRDSAPCSPTPPHACREPRFHHGEGSPVAARTTQPLPVTTLNRSQEQTPNDWDNASHMDAISSSSTPPNPSSWPSPTMTEQEITYEIFNYILELNPAGADMSHFFETASRHPPITPQSLAELDMPRIINNPKLRHDVNFDRELHFRPNFEGTKGREKLKASEEYWQALEAELFMYGFASQQRAEAVSAEQQDYWQRVLKASQRRLPKIFQAVRDILQTLVPDYEQKVIRERLDVDLIMQEITNGVCDLVSLTDWLAKVLKAHCAPMRDDLVDAMQADIVCGATQGKHDNMVRGLRQLLIILEAMKLDVANHQIRHMRPLLVEDTVNFQRRYNSHRVAMGKIDVRKSRAWLEDELKQLTADASTPTHLDGLCSALLRDVLFNETNICPPTFYLDLDRLRALRLDIRTGICYILCRDVLAELTPSYVPKAELLKAQAHLHVTVSAIVGIAGRFDERIENIAVEIVRILLILEGRFPTFDTSLLGFVEQRLERAFRPASQPFDKLARDLCDRLLPKLKASVEQCVRMSALDLQEAMLPCAPNHMPPPPSLEYGAVCAPAQAQKQYDPDEDVLNRLTHMICLHWHVWSDMVYLGPLMPEANASPPQSSSPANQAPPAAPASPTMPVAQAVYAPGKKWLPIGVTVTELPSGMPTPSTSPEPLHHPTHHTPATEHQSEQSPPEQESLDAHEQHSA